MGSQCLGCQADAEVARLTKELATERRRVELLKQRGDRQHETICRLNERLLKYEPGSQMILNDMANK